MLVIDDTIPEAHCSICYDDEVAFSIENKCFCKDCYKEIKKRCDWLGVAIEESYNLFK